MEDKSIKIDDHVNKSFNDVVADITEFVECAQRCILPHNTLLFNIIMNALEMMIVEFFLSIVMCVIIMTPFLIKNLTLKIEIERIRSAFN